MSSPSSETLAAVSSSPPPLASGYSLLSELEQYYSGTETNIREMTDKFTLLVKDYEEKTGKWLDEILLKFVTRTNAVEQENKLLREALEASEQRLSKLEDRLNAMEKKPKGGKNKKA